MKKPLPAEIEADNPEWNEDDLQQATSFDSLPAALKHSLRGRGAQKEPTKQLVSIRYSPQVINRFKSTGKGWQIRMDKALQDWLKDHDPSTIEP